MAVNKGEIDVEPMIKRMGQNIKAIRHIARLTRQEVSEGTGVGHRTIQQIENGTINSGIGNLLKLQLYFGASSTDFQFQLGKDVEMEDLYGKFLRFANFKKPV